MMVDFIIRFLTNYRLGRKYTSSRIRAIRGAWFIEKLGRESIGNKRKLADATDQADRG